MQPIDYWVIGLYLLATTLLGIWLGRGQRDRTDFFLGGHQLPGWALLLSIVATETSTVTFLSIPGQSFVDGGSFFYLQLAIGYIVGRLVIVALLLPQHFRGNSMTAYAVLEERFGTPARKAASVIFLLARTFSDGLRLFLTATALNLAIGIPMEMSVAVIAIATATYAFFGGVKSVVWNDCIQFFVYMLGAVIIVVVIASRLPGGVQQWWDFASETGRARLLDFTPGFKRPNITFWSGLFGGAFLTLATHGADQLIVQRYLCAKDQRTASWAVALSGPTVFLQFGLFLVIGAGVACYFSVFDPSRTGIEGDQALASFIASEVPAGILGVIFAAIFAAAMSTLSSSVNSSASSLLDDLGGRWTSGLSDSQSLFAARVATLFFTAAQAAVAIGFHLAGSAQSVVDKVLAVAGFSAGLLLGLYFLGLVVKRAPSAVAVVALVVGAATTSYALWMKVNGFWFPIIASQTTLVTGLLLWALLPAARTQTSPAKSS